MELVMGPPSTLLRLRGGPNTPPQTEGSLLNPTHLCELEI